ncbi:MAG TPA: nucleotide exchange factor GrpE [Aequorivita sp.]|nr:nucleotide exchange factor GrpE [Aequorivita sp.]
MSKKHEFEESELNNETGLNEEKVLEQEIDENNVSEVLSELQEEFEREKDRYLRLFAEFENYKKRTGRERLEMFRTAAEDVIFSLLPVLDDFERALKEIEKSGDDSHLEGVSLINSKLRETLRSKGLEMMKVKAGDKFDPDAHEAITQVPSPSAKLKGKIIDVVENGYTLGEKIIRYPKVVIGQ